MIKWLTDYWDSLTWTSIAIGVGIFLLSVAISLRSP